MTEFSREGERIAGSFGFDAKDAPYSVFDSEGASGGLSTEQIT